MGANNFLPAAHDAPAYGILILDVVLTTAALAGRMVSRRLMKASLSIDDSLAYIAYLANLGLLISGLLLTASGALDLDEVSRQTDQEKRFTRSAYNSLAVLYVFSITFIKLSILFMYRRIFTMLTRWFRYSWWAILTLTILWTITCVVLLALQASGKLPKSGFSRLGISITGVVNAFTDILLLGLPAAMISRMRLAARLKVALISIFLIGGIASIVSIVRGTVFFINRAHQLDEAYSNYLDIVLTATESSAGLMCACLPLMKPLVIHITKWIQKTRGIDAGHQGWTTFSDSQQSRSMPGKSERGPQMITTVDDYEIGLLAVMPKMAITEEREFVTVESQERECPLQVQSVDKSLRA